MEGCCIGIHTLQEECISGFFNKFFEVISMMEEMKGKIPVYARARPTLSFEGECGRQDGPQYP